MSEFATVSTVAVLRVLDEAEMIEGYRAGYDGAPEPGSDRSRSYWHGWRNGAVDAGRRPMDDAQRQLAREVVGKYRGLH